MNVQFEPKGSGIGIEQGSQVTFGAGKTTTYEAVSTRSGGGYSLDISGFVKDNNAYGGQGKTTEDVMREIGATDVATMQDYMTVMSNTLSGEDYKELMEDGYSVGEMPVGETVTVVDEMKATMAEAGIIIEGYNDNLDEDVLKEITGNPAYAKAIANSFKKYDVELTEQNITDTVAEIEKMSGIKDFPENAVKYMLVNGLDLTTDHLYKAAYSGGGGAIRQGQGYFAEASGGYYGKKADTIDAEALKEQFERIITEAGLAVDDTTIEEATWIVEKGIPLTVDTLNRLHKINGLTFPIEPETVTDATARAIADGSRPNQADLVREETLLEKSVQIKNETDAITDEALQAAVYDQKPLQINILATQKEISVEWLASQEKSYITAKRQLEEIRLHMTVSANYQLLKRGIQIDTLPLEKAVEALKSQEESFGRLLFTEQSEPEKSYRLWQETDLKVAQLSMMPAALVGSVITSDTNVSFTLNVAYEAGSLLQSRYDKAGETYETLMTAPRGDLGDSISKAFRNVDDILADLGKEITTDNERAVRILGYNQMEIDGDAIEKVKEADTSLREVIQELTPAKTLQMIRDGINPLETSMEELKEYLAKKEDTEDGRVEKYSRFLYELEKNDEITEREREAYIGIYRMLRQIEKSDGAAVGTILHNGQQMSFANLLSAVRTRKAGRINETVSDETGFLKEPSTYKNSISEQINAYFDAFSTEEGEDFYRGEKQAEIREAMQVSDEVLTQLLESGQTITPDHLASQKELLKHRGQLFKGLERFDTKKAVADKSAELLEHFTDVDSAREAYDEVITSAKEVLEDAMTEGSASYIDVKSMVLSFKQLSLAASLSREENYEIPVRLDGELTSVNIRILHNKTKQGEVKASFESENYGKVQARFWVPATGQVEGLVTTSRRDALSLLQGKNTNLSANILKESGKEADVNYIWQEKEAPASYQAAEKDNTVSTKELYGIAKGFLQTFAE